MDELPAAPTARAVPAAVRIEVGCPAGLVCYEATPETRCPPGLVCLKPSAIAAIARWGDGAVATNERNQERCNRDEEPPE